MKELEAEVVERNAWRVAQDVVSRIDDKPGPAGDCMKAFVTNRKEQQFFFNTEYIQQYNAAKSETRKVKVPGHNYFKKLDDFIESCMITGEMFHEYCETESVDPTPRPVPGINKLPKYHYLPVAETSITNTDYGTRREVDDYQPRTRSKQVHKKNEINIEDSASVQTFCNRHIVEESLVKKYVEHLNHLEMMSEKRKMEKKNNNLKENTMPYEEFDWMEMLNSGTLAKQRVCVLDKYIHKHNLLAVKGKNKLQKVSVIMDHLRSFAESTQANKQSSLSVEEVDDHDECEVDERDEALPTCPSDEDFVLGEIGDSSDQLSESESDC